MGHSISDSDSFAISQSNIFLAHTKKMPKHDDFAKRFSTLLAQCDDAPKTQVALARWLGVSQSFISQMKNGEKLPSTEKASVIAKKLKCSVDYLILGTEQINMKPSSGLGFFSPDVTIGKIESNGEFYGGIEAWDSKTPLNDDDVELPFFREVELAAGNGRTEVIENHGPKLRFAKATLKRQGVQAANAYCVTVSGNSMEPVLPDGSTVGVDVSDTAIKNGKMYAIDHHGSLRVKRLYALPGGGIRLKSWNDDEYPDENYTIEEAASIKIIGRVFWTSALW